MKLFFTLENVSVSRTSSSISKEEERALKLWEDTTGHTTGEFYQTGLLWKYEGIELAIRHPMAKIRLECLAKRFNPQPELRHVMQEKN